MEWMKSPKGHDVIRLNTHSYLSFGKAGPAKWMHLSYIDASGVRRGEMLPVTLTKVKAEYQKIIGKKNFALLKQCIRDNMSGDTIPRENFAVIGACLLEHESK